MPSLTARPAMTRAAAGSAHPPSEPGVEPDAKQRGGGGKGTERAFGRVRDQSLVTQQLAGATLDEREQRHDHERRRRDHDPGRGLVRPVLADQISDALEAGTAAVAAIIHARAGGSGSRKGPSSACWGSPGHAWAPPSLPMCG